MELYKVIAGPLAQKIVDAQVSILTGYYTTESADTLKSAMACTANTLLLRPQKTGFAP